MEDNVGNRVAIIQGYTSSNWRHVMSQANPANLISQGTELAALSSSALGGRDHNGNYKSHQLGPT
jgi:hypothetical protein